MAAADGADHLIGKDGHPRAVFPGHRTLSLLE
jgi:hypothetical protein